MITRRKFIANAAGAALVVCSVRTVLGKPVETEAAMDVTLDVREGIPEATPEIPEPDMENILSQLTPEGWKRLLSQRKTMT